MTSKNLPCSEQQNIGRRLEFMKIDGEAKTHLASLKPLIEAELPRGLDRFYDAVRAAPEVARFFSSDQHVAGAKNAQIGHWSNISSGNFNDDYCSKVRAIGATHARIGLEPKWYIGGYALILDHLIRETVRTHSPKAGLFGKRGTDAEDLGAMLGSLVKAVLLDMDLAISVYIDEKENQLKATQEKVLAESQAVKIGRAHV
jgi:methyl-accepting chemotaxis protein